MTIVINMIRARYLLIVVIVLSFLFCLINSITLGDEEELKLVCGNVNKVDNDRIEILEFNSEGEEVIVIYYLVSDTVFYNMGRKEDICIGECIEIEYNIREDKRIIKIIRKPNTEN